MSSLILQIVCSTHRLASKALNARAPAPWLRTARFAFAPGHVPQRPAQAQARERFVATLVSRVRVRGARFRLSNRTVRCRHDDSVSATESAGRKQAARNHSRPCHHPRDSRCSRREGRDGACKSTRERCSERALLSAYPSPPSLGRPCGLPPDPRDAEDITAQTHVPAASQVHAKTDTHGKQVRTLPSSPRPSDMRTNDCPVPVSPRWQVLSRGWYRGSLGA